MVRIALGSKSEITTDGNPTTVIPEILVAAEGEKEVILEMIPRSATVCGSSKA